MKEGYVLKRVLYIECQSPEGQLKLKLSSVSAMYNNVIRFSAFQETVSLDHSDNNITEYQAVRSEKTIPNEYKVYRCDNVAKMVASIKPIANRKALNQIRISMTVE